MKKTTVGLALAALMTLSLSAPAKTPGATACPANAPYRYRLVMDYQGGRNGPDESGTIEEVGCLEREIKTEADWAWLHAKIEKHPQITRITIVSATPLSG